MLTRLWIVLSCLSLSLFVGCGGGGSAAKCVAGATEVCACTASQQGVQTCNSAGAYGTCVCGTTPTTDAGLGDGAAGRLDAIAPGVGDGGGAISDAVADLSAASMPDAPAVGGSGGVGGTGGGGGGAVADAAVDQPADASPPDAAVGGIDGPVGTGGVGGREAGGTTSAGGTTTAGGTTAGGGTNGKGGTWGGMAPSCSGLAATCGPSGTDDCCKSLLVPGGTFDRDYDGVTPYTDPNYPATVDDFYLDKYEITVGRFRAFVNSGMGTQASPPAASAGANPLITGSGWDSTWNTNLAATTDALTSNLKCSSTYQTWTDTAGSNESQPVNCLDWYTAFAFCAWDGGRLATEAEWNYAASGGSEQRYYPWSSPATSTTIDDSYAVYCGGSCSAQNVGSKSPKGDGKWGQSDLAGNVDEWTLDWWASPYSMPCDNCADLTVYTYRVVRGGYFHNFASVLRSAYRDGGAPKFHYNSIGSRCARTSR